MAIVRGGLGLVGILVVCILASPAARAPTGGPVAGVVALVNAGVPAADPFQGQFCAGVLVGDRQVLTAAHCVAGRAPGDFVAHVGGDNLCTDAPVSGKSIAVAAISVQPAYDPTTGAFDLAMLTLAEPAGLPLRHLGDLVSEGPATAYGWGRGANGAPSCRLERIRLELPAQSACQDLFRDSPRQFDGASMVCAKPSGGANTCQGDSGGPLVAGLDPSEDGPVIGIVSWGLGCNGPGAYSRAVAFPVAGG